MDYNKEYAKKVYTGLKKRGYTDADLGEEELFVTRMGREENRRYLYDLVTERGDANIGSWERFNTRMTEQPTVEPDGVIQYLENLSGIPYPQKKVDKSQYTFTGAELGIEPKPAVTGKGVRGLDLSGVERPTFSEDIYKRGDIARHRDAQGESFDKRLKSIREDQNKFMRMNYDGGTLVAPGVYKEGQKYYTADGATKKLTNANYKAYKAQVESDITDMMALYEQIGATPYGRLDTSEWGRYVDAMTLGSEGRSRGERRLQEWRNRKGEEMFGLEPKELPREITVPKPEGYSAALRLLPILSLPEEVGKKILGEEGYNALKFFKAQNERFAQFNNEAEEDAARLTPAETFLQSSESMSRGSEGFTGEVLNLFSGSSLDDKAIIDNWDYYMELRKQVEKDPGSAIPKKDVDKFEYISELVKETGSIEAAKAEIKKRSEDVSVGDRLRMDASDAIDSFNPTEEGFGGFVAEMAPQMIGVIGSLIAGGAGAPVLAAGIGYANMGYLVSSEMGHAMKEARDAGATNLEVWLTGIANGAVELITEKLPFDYLTRGILRTGKGKIAKELVEQMAENPATREEMEELLIRAGKEMNEPLLSGRNIKKYVANVAAEGASEFTAEALQTMTTMIYENPEDYPTLTEILKNGVEGLKGGLFMGAVNAGIANPMERRANDERRKRQGYVQVARVEVDGNSYIGEILGKKESGELVVLVAGKEKTVAKDNIKDIVVFEYNDFHNGVLEGEINAAYEEAFNEEPSGATASNSVRGLNDAENAARVALGVANGVTIEEYMDGRTIEQVAMGDDSVREAVENYFKAKADFDGRRQRFQETLQKAYEASDKAIDSHVNKRNPAMVYSTMYDGQQVYITDGDVVLKEDGTIDYNNSSELYITYPDGHVEQVSANKIIGEITAGNTEELKAQARAQIDQNWKNEFDAAEVQAVEQEKRDNGVVFNMTDHQGEHRIEIVSEGEKMSEILLDGEQMKIPTKELNSWKQEAGIQTESAVVDDATDNGAPVELPEVPDFFRLGGKNYSVASRNADGSVDVMMDGKRETLPAGTDYSSMMPTNKKGDIIFTSMPVERTHEYFVQKVKDDEARAQMIEGRRKKAEAERKKFDKKPDPGIDPDAYEAKMTQWEAGKKAAQAKVDYWNEVAKREAEITRSETREAVENIKPDVVEETADEFIANHLPKITPESFKRETGLSNTEQAQLVGVISNDGVSVERAAEIITENYDSELRGLGFTGDVQDVRDIIIDTLSQGNPRSYARKGREAREAENMDQQRAEAEAWARGAFDMTLEELYLYEETLLPRIIRDYEGFDENEYYSNLAENYENDTTRESESIGRGGELLQGEQPVPAGGAPVAGQRREGGAVSNDVQGGGQNGVAQEEVPVNEPVGNSEQLSSSEIPNNQSVSEGGAPGQSSVQEITNDERVEMEARIVDWLSEDNLERASGKTRDEIFDEFGNELEPIAYIPTQYISLVSQDLKDQRIYCGKGYFIDHALRNHAKGGKQLNAEDVDVSKYLNIQSVLDNPDSVKETYVDGKRTVVFIKKIGRYFAELTQVEEDGKIVLHKSMFDQKKEPYAKLDDIRSKGTSSEGGVSSISHTAEAAPAISLESRGDVVSNSTESSASEDRNSVSNSQENTQKSGEIAENGGEKAVPSGKLKAKSGKQSLADRVLARAEEKRRIPLRERARELEAQVGVKANIIESLDEVKNREAKERIAAGEAVAGWYSGGQVYLYMPNIKDRREIELTYVHEVVAHHGVKKLLGDRFNEFLDGVWNMMSEADRARMLAYVGANENPTLQDMRAAADEYVAELAEKMNLGELEQSTWEKIVDWFKKILENIGFENLTKEDIESMLKASYSNLRAESGKGKTGSTENAKQTKAEKYRKMREDLEGLGVFGEVALPKGYKWSDGKKYGGKGGRRGDSSSITALVIGDDLYLRDNQKIGGIVPFVNLNNKNHQTAVIRNFRQWPSIGDFMTAVLDVGYQFDRVTEDAINEIFTQNGIGFNRSILRPMFRISRTPQEFDATQAEAVEKRGIVAPGLNEADVNVVDVPRHDFTGTGKEAIGKARLWAKENLVGEYTANEGTDNEFRYSIDDKSIKKYLSGVSTSLSDNLGVHLSVLKVLPDVINESIEVEVHADYKKGNGRSVDNGIEDENLLIHRLYGAVYINGELHRVKTTLKERKAEGVKPYTYEVTKIELLGGSSPKGTSLSDAPNNSISATKLLEGVEKSYDKGKKVLVESENSSENPQDAESGIRFRKKDSERRQEKRRINDIIDTAAGFVTVGGKKQATKNRLKKEAERKQLAKEMYSSVLKGDFNDVTLSQIDKFIEDATPANPFGRRISQRLPQRMERALRQGARTNAVDALFSRISESAVPANERFSEAGRREIEERKKELLKGWAIATGNWHTDLKEFTDDTEPIGEGKDSKVYSSKDGRYVIKASKGKPYGKRFRPDIDNIALFNDVFRDTRYEILGYGEIDGEFVRILQQPIVDFAQSTPLTSEERREYMQSLGFEPLNDANTAFADGEIVIADLQKGNVVRDAAGNISVIDADAKLHTKDVGGDYTYPPVEEDLPEQETRFRTTPTVDGKPFHENSYGLWKILPKSEWPQGEPDYVSRNREGGVSSQYWYGEDEGGEYIIRKSDHWSDDISRDKKADRFMSNLPYRLRTRAIRSAYWALDYRNSDFFNGKNKEYFEKTDGKTEKYGKIYLEDLQFEDSSTRFRIANENQEVFVSNAQRAVEGIQQNKATAEQWIAMLKKNGGLKAGEDAWLGLEEWLNERGKVKGENGKVEPVTKQEILDYIAQNRIQIEEVKYSENARFKGQSYYADRYNAGEADDVMPANDTRLNYTTDGLDNKREIALTVPTVESYNTSDEVHFGDAGNGRAVAWVRFGETTDSEGNRVLVIDEIQSKRHQEGREKGYGRATSEDVKSALEAVNAAQSEFDEYNAEMAKKYGSEYDWNIDATDAEIDKWQELYDKVAQLGQVYEDVAESNRKGIPPAPFEKNWHELAMKRMLRLAAEEGFDKVAWTTGEQQAERYSLGTYINSIERFDVDDRGKRFELNGPARIGMTVGDDGVVIASSQGEYEGKPLSDVVGKELAEKMLAMENRAKLEDLDLKVGGEGMKGFYDRMLPSFVQKYTKKWGAKVGEVTMPSLEENNTMWSVDVTPEMQESVMQGQTMFRMGSRVDARMAEVTAHFEGKQLTAEQQAVVDVFGGKADNLTISVKTKDGNERKVVMRQGNEMGAGAKHSLFRHFGMNNGAITADDILLIPEILANGEHVEKKRGKKTVIEHKYTDNNGVEYTVLTEIDSRREAFANFYTNKKASSAARKTRSEEARDIADDASEDKGSDNSSNTQEGEARFRTVEEGTGGSIDDVPAQPLTLMERITNSLLEVSAKNKENLGLRADALRTFGRDINRVLSLMKAQREYDKSTVDTLVKLAKMYFKNAQLLGEVDTYTMGRVLSLINNVVGKRDVTASAAKLMDILLDAHTKALAGILDKAEKVKAKKVNAAGVEVMGRLDKYGQRRVDEYRTAKEMTPEKLEEAIYDSDNRLAELEQRVREALSLTEGDDVDQAARDYTGDNDVVNVYMDERARLEGLTLAREYKESIQQVQEEIKGLKKELKQAEEDYRLGNIDGKSLKEFRKSVAEAIMESKAELIEGYHNLIYKFQENTKESSKKAKAFAQAQFDRAREIQHNANSDMEGISAATQGTHPENYNNAVMNALRSPFPTFQGMLKKFGEKNVEGKGYLYERFIPQATKAGDNEFRGKVAARVMIEGKLKEIYGKKMTIAKFMKSLREDGVTIEYREGNEMKQFDLTKGQMLYIYMVNKMADGQMKLRRMGVTDDVVAELMTKLPEEAVQFADWAQNELLKDLRGKYNAVHERVFGAPMAAIENYFPIKIRKEARGEKGDVSEVGQEGKPSTVTGSIIKRTKNATAIDLSADAMQVLMEHIDDMEHWAAFAEFNRDLNVLLNYKHFQNQVKNMTSVRYGSGTELWKNFEKTAQIVSGTYRPSDSSIDRAVQNIAKGLTRSKINFRLFTAVKQLLSAPAFWTDAGVEELAYCYANPKGSFGWAKENLPGFAERWQGRTMGNEKLLKSDSDWEIWRNEFVEAATRWGMTLNAAIDALTVAQGARAVYMTKLKQFKKAGYTEQRANEKALQAAAEAYNESQQSSEGVYLSPLQVEGTALAAVFTTFKNSNFGYTRKTAQAIANIKRKMRKEYKEETIAFMTKQMIRDGLSEENAKKMAERVYNKSKYKDVANVAMFGFGLNLLWEAGGMAIYLLFGDDDEEKEKMKKEIAVRGSLGLLNGIPFGETMISAAMAVKEGDTKYFRLPQLVAVGDIENLAQVLNYDPVRGANDIVNMLTSIGVGVTPQVLTDILVALGDVEEFSAEELGMFAARFVNAPQSNLDRLMVDDAMENSAINAEEIMQRYAEYKKSKNAPITQFLYSDEGEQKAVERYEKKFAKLLEERLENVVEDNDVYDLFYENADVKMKSKLAKMRQKYLAGDKAKDFEKLDAKELVERVLYGSGEINETYFNLSTAEDEDAALAITFELKKLEDIYNKGKDLMGEERRNFKKANSKEYDLYEDLKKIERDISRKKTYMEKHPEKADKAMEYIRKQRAKAIKLINEYYNE